jgi:hypothetical protein
MARKKVLLCHCWEIDMGGDDPESVLAGLRRESPGLLIQVFGGRRPNPSAIEMVAAQTLTAARSGSMVADRPELDLLLRLAGTRQIGKAFRLMGYKSAQRKLFIVAASEGNGEMGRLLDELSLDRRFVKMEKKPLTKDDLDLVERAALLAASL